MEKLNKLILTGIFLSIAGLLIIIQIPVFLFFKLDFSLVIIIISEIYIGIFNALLIGILSPLMVLIVYGDPIGMLFLMILNLVVISVHYFVYKKNNIKNIILSSILIIIFSSLIISILNILVFVPLFYGFNYINDFMTTWLYWILVMIFNLTKLTIVYILIAFYFQYLYKNNQDILTP